MTRPRKSPPTRTAAPTRAPLSFPAFGFARHRFGRCDWAFGAVLTVVNIVAIGLPSVCAGGSAHASPASIDAADDPYAAPIAEASQRFNIPAAWLLAVMRVESGGNALAVSPKGAMGLMQIMPDTWTELHARYQLGADPFDPHDNIMAGAGYLRELLDRFGTAGFLAAYNAGPSRFEDYLAGLRPLNGETQHYVSTLAHMLPDVGIASGGTNTATSGDQHSAGLFVATSSPSSPPSDAPAGHPSAATSNEHNFALAPQSNALFVAVRTASQR